MDDGTPISDKDCAILALVAYASRLEARLEPGQASVPSAVEGALAGRFGNDVAELARATLHGAGSPQTSPGAHQKPDLNPDQPTPEPAPISPEPAHLDLIDRLAKAFQEWQEAQGGCHALAAAVAVVSLLEWLTQSVEARNQSEYDWVRATLKRYGRKYVVAWSIFSGRARAVLINRPGPASPSPFHQPN